MIKVKVQRKLDSTIITHKLEKNEQINKMEMDIVGKGEIETLVCAQVQKSMFGTKMKFAISDYIDIASYLRSGINYEEFSCVVENVIRTFQECKAHGIRISNLEVRPEYVFYSHKDKKARMLYWPLISLAEYAEEKPLFEKIGELYACRKEDEAFRNCYVSYFDSHMKFDLFHFEKNVESLKKRWLERENKEEPEINMKPDLSEDIYNVTVSLLVPTLLQVKNNKKIEIKKTPFTIGRSAQDCDYAVENNPTVGRKPHATIQRSSEGYTITDNNSTNGVQIGGEYIHAGDAVRIKSGDTIEIGTEEFVFFAPAGK